MSTTNNYSVDQPSGDAIRVLPLINVVLFPHASMSLLLTTEHAIQAVAEAVASDRVVLALSQRDIDLIEVGVADLYTVGVEAVVERVRMMPDGSTNVVVQGRRRMRVRDVVQEQPFIRVRATPLFIDEERTLAIEAMMRAVLSLFEKVVKLSRSLPDDAYISAINVADPGWLADLVAATLPLSMSNRQQILETLSPEERLHRVSTLLMQELDVLELESRIQSQVQKEVDRSQREIFLREQLKAIQRELGQDDPLQRDLLDLRGRIESSGMPEEPRTKALNELERLEAMPSIAPEYALIRTYLDWLLSLPWAHASDGLVDLRTAKRALDQNHYGLPKVKDRILEFIAVRQLAGAKHKSPILCFVGPPGVGKTSLGRSIADVLGRSFGRMSLGGMRDEAEIRGHRRTYIGALPGRVIQTMKTTGTTNPVIMLDEIDKVGNDFRGDPSAALLEVLDPEQNHSFSDHYLDVPYNLSQVLFITTANILDPIADALLDRMEVIELSGYTEDEKLQIARQFLVPKQYEANGLPQNTPHFSPPALRQLIRDYTYEAGVRNLEREISAVCRKIARRIAEDRSYPRMVTPALLLKYLGAPRYSYGEIEHADQIGIATGIVYTSNGGDTMPIEVTLMEGKGNLMLTGQLGEVMQESAQAALSYARTHARALGIAPSRFEKLDIHVHVPEGGVPKEGPSAGITLAAALISALTKRAVRRDVAMTGELTLRGRVLPVGGVKEKVLGSYRAGIYEIVLPDKNERDIAELTARVRSRITFHYVSHIDDVLSIVLAAEPAPVGKPKHRKQGNSTAKAAADEA